jgi:hypothetical protein
MMSIAPPCYSVIRGAGMLGFHPATVLARLAALAFATHFVVPAPFCLCLAMAVAGRVRIAAVAALGAECAMTARRAGQLRLLVLALCLLPVAAAWFSYRFWPPQGGKSYGEMLPTHFVAAEQQPGRVDSGYW